MRDKKEIFQVSVQLKKDVTEQLNAMVRASGFTISEVISYLISKYYMDVFPKHDKNVLEILRKHGMVGCIKAGKNFSRDYKKHHRSSAKRGHR